MGYAKTGSPFNFKGHFSESQSAAMAQWTDARMGNFPQIALHHRIRAQRLRKTVGLLEAIHAANGLTNSFQKDAWKPGPDGHWFYGYRDDHVPAVTMGKLKRYFQPQMESDDTAVFFMNHLRNRIEQEEDLAQYASEAPSKVPSLWQKIKSLFGKPEYQAVLVRDISDTYKGEPRFRVHQLDEPTRWEKEQHNHGATADSPLLLKM